MLHVNRVVSNGHQTWLCRVVAVCAEPSAVHVHNKGNYDSTLHGRNTMQHNATPNATQRNTNHFTFTSTQHNATPRTTQCNATQRRESHSAIPGIFGNFRLCLLPPQARVQLRGLFFTFHFRTGILGQFSSLESRVGVKLSCQPKRIAPLNLQTQRPMRHCVTPSAAQCNARHLPPLAPLSHAHPWGSYGGTCAYIPRHPSQFAVPLFQPIAGSLYGTFYRHCHCGT